MKNREAITFRLIDEDFKMINLFSKLANAGFIGMDYPSITSEVLDLIGVPEEARTDELMDRYTHWAVLSEGLDKTDRFIAWVYKELEEVAQEEEVLVSNR